MTIELIIRLIVSALLGGAIGLEREYRSKGAGFRTHFLVALGSSLFMVISQHGFDDPTGLDPSRIAAQVVSGIGFIGAGTIIFQKHIIKGLTTAAGLWVTSAIGLASGAGMYVIAVVTTVLVLLGLEALNILLGHFGTRQITISFTSASKELTQNVISNLRQENMDITSFNQQERMGSDGREYHVTLDLSVSKDKFQTKITDLMDYMTDVTIEKIE